MEIIQIPFDVARMISTSSKGDQSKWLAFDKWVKQNARGYEGQAEILASQVLSCTTLVTDSYVTYYPCLIELPDEEQSIGCYSHDFKGKLQEVTLEHLFKTNFT